MPDLESVFFTVATARSRYSPYTIVLLSRPNCRRLGIKDFFSFPLLAMARSRSLLLTAAACLLLWSGLSFLAWQPEGQKGHFPGPKGSWESLQTRHRLPSKALANSALDLAPVPQELEAPEQPSEIEVVEVAVTRAQLVRGTAAGMALANMGAAGAAVAPEWVQYDLNTGETLYDVDFDENDPNHGFIVGARALFYETRDGGQRWVSRSFANLGKGEDISYRFQTVSLNGDEVWIVGKPPLLLHSKDSGKSWKKVPISKKLPGEPKVIVSLGPGKAEMATSSGAIYVTENDGKNWKSQVSETIDATLNRVSQSGVSGGSYFTGSVKSIKRNSKGEYLAIAQRGNFYLSFVPGDTRWVPHNRISARRIQGMGFRDCANGEKLDGAWMSLNGGVVTLCDKNTFTDLASDTKELFQLAKIRSGGIGIIDIGYRTPNECWATGGSGVIYTSKDGGKTWAFDPSATDLPCNLYNVPGLSNADCGVHRPGQVRGFLTVPPAREGEGPISGNEVRGPIAAAALQCPWSLIWWSDYAGRAQDKFVAESLCQINCRSETLIRHLKSRNPASKHLS
ncbi:hcf136 [Symbiodinium natans]|uniref:Hcf136 protein n=1 Tax=Symbiodinium natans TaxID=878477 RepID=A0A812SX58_9DINO|nr:hcf136 [Symbiodinium natans]